MVLSRAMEIDDGTRLSVEWQAIIRDEEVRHLASTGSLPNWG